jgi:ATP-dependent helicase/nuclease subunit A
VLPTGETLYAFRRNLVVAASAGTGKTHGLVGVLVHLLLGASELGEKGRLHDPVDPARVVATTFSRKAAAEIRARIVEELERLVVRDPAAKYRADLDAACARAGVLRWSDAHVQDRARRALDGIARAQIGTLHGYAATLARAHALEAGLSPSFEMAGEEDSRRRVEDAIVRVLEARRADVRPLVDVAGGVDRLVSQIARLLARLEEDGRSADALVVPQDDARRLDELMQALVTHARALEGEPRYADAARVFLDAWTARAEERLADATADLCGVRATAKRTHAVDSFVFFRDRLPWSNQTNAEHGRRLARAWLRRESFVEAGAMARRVLADCQAEIARDVTKSSLLGFGDVLRVARDVLRDHPGVAREVGRSLEVLLVDEFQDTSRLQRDLVQLVWARDDRRTHGAVPRIGDVRGHGLFVVGDRKQSIYGFRGADVGLFAELCVGLAGAAAREALGIAAGAAWEPDEPSADFVSLRYNRRGNAGLLAFANAFSRERFRVREPPAKLFEIDYVAGTEDLLVPPEGEGEAPVPRTTWIRFGEDVEPTRLEEAHAMADRIRAIIERREPRVAGRDPSWRDVAILAPTNEMLDAAAFALAEAGVPHVVAGRGFYSATEVRDLASLLELVQDPRDKLALLEVLRGPWAGVHDATLVGLTDPGRGLAELGPAWDAGERRDLVREEDRHALAELRRVVDGLWRNLDRLGPGGVLRAAVRELHFEETLVLLPRGEQRVANVRKLVAMADRETSVTRFLSRLDDLMAREVAEAEAATFSDEDDAVRLLTVHASKGLDFPIVFVPQIGLLPRPRERGVLALDLGGAGAEPTLTARLPDPDVGTLEPPSFVRSHETADRRERAERQRLAYVAMTRASEAMFLVGDKKPPRTGDGVRYWATDASAVRALAGSEEARCAALLELEEVPPRSAPVAREDGAHEPPAPLTDPRLAPPAWGSLAIAPTSLQDFAHCPRRFQLAHVLGLPERAPAGVPVADPRDDDGGGAPRLDARSEGTLAHKVLERLPRDLWGGAQVDAAISDLLEREGLAMDHPTHAAVAAKVARFAGGAYAARIARAGASVAREVPFVLRVSDDRGHSLALRGSIDLLVTWPDGAVEVVDYKRARGPSPEPYAFQLDVYLLAARDMAPDAPGLRAGIVFLGGEASDPVWRKPPDFTGVRARLAKLATDLVTARWTDAFPRAAPTTCRAIRCGYFRMCHPGKPA